MPQRIDLTGRTFDRLTVLGPVGVYVRGNRPWLCRCACGGPVVVRRHRTLLAGGTRSCGCISAEAARQRIAAVRAAGGPKRIELTGMVFGRLTVIGPGPIGCRVGATLWRCKCECGQFRAVISRRLRNGETRSCNVKCRG